MKTVTKVLAVASLCVGSAVCAYAAGKAKSYQVTGPVIELTDTKIVVEKDKENWEITRTKDSKVTGDLKVGAKVTVYYTMTATDIEAKPAKK